MTDKEKVFVEKFNEMLFAAKEMEKEGNVVTKFEVTISSSKNYELSHQKILHAIDGYFLENGYTLKR